MKNNESGEVNILLIVAVFISLVAIGFAIAFFWAFGERNHFMNDSDAIVAVAVDEALEVQKAENQIWHEEEMKKPLLDFKGPADFGSVQFQYPRTWAAFRSESTASRYIMFFNPKIVPSPLVRTSTYALRVTITNESYESVIAAQESAVSSGKLTVKPITAGPDKEFSGMRFNGTFDELFKGSLAVFKIRDKTLTLRTDSQDFVADFNNIILPSLRFTP